MRQLLPSPGWRAATATLLAVASSACTIPAPALPARNDAAAQRAQTPQAHTLGHIRDEGLDEISGLARSIGHDNLLWAINDSGNAAALHALDLNGRHIGTWPVLADNRDWESLASGFVNGAPTLLIGETGDNLRQHDSLSIYLVPEPDPEHTPADTPLPARELRFQLADGPRDIESMTLAHDAIWLLSKEPPLNGRAQASRLYRLPLHGAGSREAVATLQALLMPPAETVKTRLAIAVIGIDLNQPTDFLIDAEHRQAWVLTYRQVRRFDRQSGESWAAALARAPSAIFTHRLSQAEAMTHIGGGRVVITSERTPAPLVALSPVP